MIQAFNKKLSEVTIELKYLIMPHNIRDISSSELMFGRQLNINIA